MSKRPTEIVILDKGDVRWGEAVPIDAERHAKAAVDFLLDELGRSDKPIVPLMGVYFRILERFAGMVRKDDGRAAGWLLTFTNEAVRMFEKLHEEKPALFLPLTRRSLQIPATIGAWPEKARSVQRILERLEVGKEAIFDIAPKKGKTRHWEFSNPANAMAAQLVFRIMDMQELNWLFMATGKSLPAWEKQALRLKPFSPRTWRQWADVGWEIVKSESPEGRPEINPLFFNPATKICNVRAESGRAVHMEPRSTARHDIKEALYRAFKVISGEKTLPTTRP